MPVTYWKDWKMRNSNYARLIQAEQVYKEKIRQLEEKLSFAEKENKELRELIDPSTLEEYDNGDFSEHEIIDGEIVDLAEESQYGWDTPEPWTMWHDPDGNEYEPNPVGLSTCLVCGQNGFTVAGWTQHRQICKVPIRR